MPPSDYAPAVAELLRIPHPVSLGPGTPDAAAGERLRRLDAAGLFVPAIVRDADMANACLAGLWLRFDDRGDGCVRLGGRRLHRRSL